MKLLTALLLLTVHYAIGQHFRLEKTETGTGSSFRGLSVADDSLAWAGGNNGWVGNTVNGGRTWQFKKVPDYEHCDFRSIYGFSSTTAVIANAGAPAFILRTDNGGNTWKEVYRNDDTAAFFDGIAFWNNNDGIIYGDPIDGRMLLLQTKDGGRTWQPLQGPVLTPGEISFAASGTAIRCTGNRKAVIATGGKVSRLWYTGDRGSTWLWVKTPIIQGRVSTGIFSIACGSDGHTIIAGGDYLRDTARTDHVFVSDNNGATWIRPATATGGYRECVEYINNNTAIATGPTGTDITLDGGITWRPLSSEKGFHTIKKARKGSLIVMTGSNGIVAVLTLQAALR